jgi:glycosyltransferase involved in cell wall biosynthesis
MRLLLIHQNFPAQFRHLARGLVQRGHEVAALGTRPLDDLAAEELPPGVLYGGYAREAPIAVGPCLDPEFEASQLRGLRVAEACRQLVVRGFQPDVVLFHSAWGEGLHLRDVWPELPLVAYPELYGSPLLFGYGYDERLGPASPQLQAGFRRQNLLSLAAIADSDAVVVPTHFQRSTFPDLAPERFLVLHEGIDVEAMGPDPTAALTLPGGLTLRAGDPVVTFCSRSLEPLRGLGALLRALPALQRAHAAVQVVIVGSSGSGYGPPSPHPGGHLGALLEELEGRLDLARLHILEPLPYAQLIRLFQLSAAHAYLSYPYALSWSALEAMACGAPLVGSRGPTLAELIRPEQNGLLVGFNEPGQLAAALLRLLEDPALRRRLGAAARRTVVEHYSLQAGLDGYEALFSRLVAARARRGSVPAPSAPGPASRDGSVGAAG